MRSAKVTHPRAGGIEETWDPLGLSRGNERSVEAYVFSLTARSSTSPPPFGTRGRVDCSDLPLHQQADLGKEEREKSRKSADLPPTGGEAAEEKLDLEEEGGSRQPRRCGR